MFSYLKFIILLTTFIGVTLGNDWTGHKTKFGLKFSTTTEEKDRQAIWTQNMDAINRHNQKASSDKSVTYTMGANQFTHLSHDEFVARHTDYMRHKNGNRKALIPAKTTTTIKSTTAKPATITTSLPKVDWRGTPLVGPIKDQGNCG